MDKKISKVDRESQRICFSQFPKSRPRHRGGCLCSSFGRRGCRFHSWKRRWSTTMTSRGFSPQTASPSRRLEHQVLFLESAPSLGGDQAGWLRGGRCMECSLEWSYTCNQLQYKQLPSLCVLASGAGACVSVGRRGEQQGMGDSGGRKHGSWLVREDGCGTSSTI